MSSALRRVALVTGANKGIGYHIVQQFATAEPASTVLLGARDSNKGKEALATLKLKNIEPLQLDIDEPSSIERAVREVKQKYGGLDLLVNNAGRPGENNGVKGWLMNRDDHLQISSAHSPSIL